VTICPARIVSAGIRLLMCQATRSCAAVGSLFSTRDNVDQHPRSCYAASTNCKSHTDAATLVSLDRSSLSDCCRRLGSIVFRNEAESYARPERLVAAKNLGAIRCFPLRWAGCGVPKPWEFASSLSVWFCGEPLPAAAVLLCVPAPLWDDPRPLPAAAVLLWYTKQHCCCRQRFATEPDRQRRRKSSQN